MFARKIWPEADATPETLRDHAWEILRASAQDMRSDQTDSQQTQKSKGSGSIGLSGTELDAASMDHARGRATSGLSLPEVVAEYRALRASVIRLWIKSSPSPDHRDLADLTRFNETIDQSLAEAVRGYTRQVDQARQMFLAILAHDLRNPLNAIMVLADTLSDTPSDVEVAGQIRTSAKAMSRMLTDFLDFANTQLGKSIPLTRNAMDLTALCEEVIGETQSANPERKLHVTTRGDLTGEWDAGRLRQLLSNLLGNAIQHGAANGTIELTAKEAGNDVDIWVTNEGESIPAELLPRIFEPLSRGISPDDRKKTREGSMGLGLYIADQVVRAHGGTITVKSKPGETTFWVRLPRQVRRPSSATVVFA